MALPKRARTATKRFGDFEDDEYVGLVLKHVAAGPLGGSDSRWQAAVRIKAEKKELGCKREFLVEFADSAEPEWADKVSPRLLARWRAKQQGGEEKELVEYLGLSPDNLEGAVAAEDRQSLLKSVALNILKVLRCSLVSCKSRRSLVKSKNAFTIPCKPKEFCALFPAECAEGIQSNSMASVFSNQGFSLALSFAEACELLDDVVPGWWSQASEGTPTTRLIDRKKMITFGLRVHGVMDCSHKDCPACMRQWTVQEAFLIPKCVSVCKIKLAGVGELRVSLTVREDRVDRLGGPFKPLPALPAV